MGAQACPGGFDYRKDNAMMLLILIEESRGWQ